MAEKFQYTPQEPTMILNTTQGSVTLLTKLYGEMTPARLEKEKALHKHRLEQLQPPVKLTPAEEYRKFKAEEREARTSRRMRGDFDTEDFGEDDFEYEEDEF